MLIANFQEIVTVKEFRKSDSIDEAILICLGGGDVFFWTRRTSDVMYY